MPAAASSSSSSSSSSSISLSLEGALGTVMYFLNLDVQNRLRRLARLRLIPRFFGQDFSRVFLQHYRGHVTIAPRLSILDQFGALSHPSPADMRRYIRQGEQAAWPRLAHVHTLVRVEHALAAAAKAVHGRMRVTRRQGASALHAGASADDRLGRHAVSSRRMPAAASATASGSVPVSEGKSSRGIRGGPRTRQGGWRSLARLRGASQARPARGGGGGAGAGASHAGAGSMRREWSGASLGGGDGASAGIGSVPSFESLQGAETSRFGARFH